MATRTKENYSKEESKLRFEAALRGARLAGHKTMNDIPKKNGESRKPKTHKQKRR